MTRERSLGKFECKTYFDGVIAACCESALVTAHELLQKETGLSGR
jgi:hypothetical protein